MTSLDTTASRSPLVERSLTTLGVNQRGAAALADAFDDVDAIVQQPPEALSSVDGVGPTTVEELEELHPDPTPFDPRDLIDGETITVNGYDIELSAVEVPESLPTSQAERQIATSEHFLKRVNRLAEQTDC